MASACQVRLEKLESSRGRTEADNIYNNLLRLQKRAECDRQYDPTLPVNSTEAFISYEEYIMNRQEIAKFIFVLGLGLTAVTLWRNAF